MRSGDDTIHAQLITLTWSDRTNAIANFGYKQHPAFAQVMKDILDGEVYEQVRVNGEGE